MTARLKPQWQPRVMRAGAAAHHTGYETVHEFLTAVACGEMPLPFQLGGADVWDATDLELAIDAVKGGAKGTLEQRAEEYAQKRRMAGR